MRASVVVLVDERVEQLLQLLDRGRLVRLSAHLLLQGRTSTESPARYATSGASTPALSQRTHQHDAGYGDAPQRRVHQLGVVQRWTVSMGAVSAVLLLTTSLRPVLVLASVPLSRPGRAFRPLVVAANWTSLNR